MILELLLLSLPVFFMMHIGNDESKETIWNKPNSMTFRELSYMQLVSFFVRRFYNAYLEYIYFEFPKYRTQGNLNVTRNTILNCSQTSNTIEPCGRNKIQLRNVYNHEKLTIISQSLLTNALYFGIPDFYPYRSPKTSFLESFLRFISHQYILSFGMYWMHKSLHDVNFLWKHIHSIHHYSKHPISRVTYEDHWLENLINAIVGRVFAQILIPIDNRWFWVSTIVRIMESLEKHSGISSSFNLIHTFCKNVFPYSQMPHHHDYHHEGFKSSNFTFTSLGGIWDCLFGTRRIGRYSANDYTATTRFDLKIAEYQKKHKKHKAGTLSFLSRINSLVPVVLLTLLVLCRLNSKLHNNSEDLLIVEGGKTIY